MVRKRSNRGFFLCFLTKFIIFVNIFIGDPMRRKLMIDCPQCDGGKSDYFYGKKLATCSFCGGTKETDLFHLHQLLNIVDERNSNSLAFVNDSRFTEYLEARNKRR